MTPMICMPLFGVGMSEWLIIILVIAVLFGGSKIPKLGKGLGEGIRNFKKGISGELDDEKPSPSASTIEKSEEPATADKEA